MILLHTIESQKIKKILEKIDSELGNFLEKDNYKLRIGITVDHSKNNEEGIHVYDPAPVLINVYGIKADYGKKLVKNITK